MRFCFHSKAELHAIFSDDHKGKFPDFLAHFPANCWFQTTGKYAGSFYIRKQIPDNKQVCSTEESIDLNDLKQKFFKANSEETLWYHATGWQSAEDIMLNGIKLFEHPGDLAPCGAFYLNPCYFDCYDWLSKKNYKFKNKHAILIYSFDPNALSKKGETALTKTRWQKLTRDLSNRVPGTKYDWLYTLQNQDPSSRKHTNSYAKARETYDGESAKQLIIYTEKMCTKIDNKLVGFVFYEFANINSTSLPPTISKSVANSNETKKHKRRIRSHKTKA